MAEKPTRRSVRYATKKPAKKAGFHWFRNLLLIGFVAGGFVLMSYLGYLDYNVRNQFDGKRWAIPARVYADPVELYTGYNISAEKLEELLQTLNYRKDAQLSLEGSYFRTEQQILIKTRQFEFWDELQESRSVKLTFNETGIGSIVALGPFENGGPAAEIPIIRMDPVQIGNFYPTIKEDRILIKLSDAPDALVKGLLASEDRDFYQHFGVSMRGIARAMWANVRAGDMVQGGSTITQQLAKNFYLSSERKLSRKLKEMLMALILEYRYPKDAIMEAYLNEIYLGQDGANGVHGFGLASEFYFGNTLKDLPLDQVALLVALVRGPSEYDPRRYPDRALQRRNLVLDEMAMQKYITEGEAMSAKAKPLSVIPRKRRTHNRYPGFLELVKRQLKADYREEDFTSEGLKIFTTLDTQIQETVEKTAAAKLRELEKLPKANDLETAIIVTRKDSGEIVALVSGRENAEGGFNRALDAVRPIGSLIKPAVYLTALEDPKKYTITTRVSDSSITVRGQNGTDWTPKNYDHREHGSVPLHKALAKSYNLATVRIGMDIGIAKTAKTLKQLGVNKEVDLYPSLLLGASSLTPMDVTQMYQTIAGGGFLTPIKAIRAVISSDAKHLQSYPFNVKETVDPDATYIVNTILQEVMREGTGNSAYNAFPKDYGLAGKTGTTNDAKDSWFAGYTGDYLSVVWVGRDDNKPIGLTGATGALPIWTALMRQISTQPVTLDQPENIRMLAVDACGHGREYPYIAGSEPGIRPCEKQTDGAASEDEEKPWFEPFERFIPD
ncbi:penicillin-binding protein 1B [Methylovulum miyakonense]|uniref:penicillin-binding protein 1B n=1 Tax=Methylovulum miyakonense TaxID=645578 RepID=UPI000A03B60C|nr:penicillin-binding protein 1B [Methylovulum miyakonense]